MRTTPRLPRAKARAGAGRYLLAGFTAMACVGGSAGIASKLVPGPLFAAQAVRYSLACAVLLVWGRRKKRPLTMPSGSGWCWLAGLAATGLVLFNIALVEGSRGADPALPAVAIACAPLALAIIGPIIERRRPNRLLVLAAVVVALGASLVIGFGRAAPMGVAWATTVFASEAAFTLLALPVLPAHGAWGVSVHTTWMAAALFAMLSLVIEGPGAVLRLHTPELLAVLYLVLATAIAFLCWFSCVGGLGPARAGLLTGIVPVTAALTGTLLGGPLPNPLSWTGIVVVAGGLALGLARARPR